MKRGLTEEITKAAKAGIVPMIMDFLSGLAKKAQDIAYYTEQKLLQFFYASVFFTAGAIFVCIAVVFLLNEYTGLSMGWGLLIIGLFLLLLATIVKRHAVKTKYYR